MDGPPPLDRRLPGLTDPAADPQLSCDDSTKEMYDSGANDGMHEVLATLITLLLCGYGVMVLYRVLRRGRPELRIGLPLLVAFGVRLISLVALPLTGIERTLRGGD